MRAAAVALALLRAAAFEPRLYVVSLPRPPTGPDGGTPASRVWRWKEAALGHGQDYFTWPKAPHRALGDALCARAPARGGGDDADGCGGGLRVVEAAALGTCARLDFYIAAETVAPETDAARLASLAVAGLLLDVTRRWRAAGAPQYSASAGLAGLAALTGGDGGGAAKLIRECERALPASPPDDDLERVRACVEVLEGPEACATHVARVACSLASRGARRRAGERGGGSAPPRGSPEHFDPFDARDAHVMHQLRKALEAATTPPPTPPREKPRRVRALLETALAVGAAARDARKTPAIQTLRGNPSRRQRAAAAAAVEETLIAPAAAELAAALSPARAEAERRVARMRRDAEEAAESAVKSICADDTAAREAARAAARAALHAPTIAIRDGEVVDESAVVLSVARAASEAAVTLRSKRAELDRISGVQPPRS